MSLSTETTRWRKPGAAHYFSREHIPQSPPIQPYVWDKSYKLWPTQRACQLLNP